MEIQFQVAVSGFWFPVSKARQRLAPVAGGELAEKYWKLETGNWFTAIRLKFFAAA